VICDVVLQTVNDTAPEVRDASFQALGTAMKVVTEKNIMAYMADVDPLKMQKVGNKAPLWTSLGLSCKLQNFAYLFYPRKRRLL